MSTRSPVGLIRVALLDDHEVVRSGIQAELDKAPGIKVVSSQGDSKSFLRSLKKMPADVAVLDYSLTQGDTDGLALVKLIRAEYPSLKILIVSAYEEGIMVHNLMKAGVRGFVGKSRNASEIIKGIVAIFRDETYRSYSGMNSYTPPTLDSLSKSEYEVARLFASGMTVGEIAKTLNKSVKTISSQKTGVNRKLDVKNDVELLSVLLPHFKSVGSSS